MRKWIIGAIALFAIHSIQAQELSTSPYSGYGIGEPLFDNNTEQGGMGGISTVNANPYGQSANFYNPAANSSLRMVNFNMSLRGDNTNYKFGNVKENSGTAYISNLSLAFPLSPKSQAGFGYQPYTTTGFNILKIDSVSSEAINSQNKGNGGINSVHAFYNRNITPNLSVGVRGNFLFGEQEKHEIVSMEEASLLTDHDTKVSYSGFQFTLGTMYNKKLNNDYRLNVGATYTLGSNIKAQYTNLISTYNYAGNSIINLDTISFRHDKNAKAKLPQQVSLGAAFGKDLKWNIAAEAKYTSWTDYENPVYDGNESILSQVDYKDSYRLALGGYFIPNFNSYKSYFDRIIYRAGVYYERGSYNVNHHQINRYGATLGFGLPVGKTNDGSMLNIALEYGQRGSTDYNLIKENYLGFRIGFDFNDIWFRKRVID